MGVWTPVDLLAVWRMEEDRCWPASLLPCVAVVLAVRDGWWPLMEDAMGGRAGAAMGMEDGCWIGRTVMGSAAMAAERKWGRWVFNLFAMCALMLEEDRGI
ncbi:hypothetical protein ACLOJK_015223 [Asimina triloba]